MTNQDRISNLPDEVLQSIICLIPFKSATRTSILSKRWRNLWKSLLISAKALDFDDEFSTTQSPKDFVRTVYRYLQLHGNQKLDSFRIVFSPFDLFQTDIDNWISIAAAKGIEELVIDLSQGIIDSVQGYYLDDRKAYQLPDCLLDCKLLTRLSLSRCSFRAQFQFTSLNNLRFLILNYVDIKEGLFEKMLAGLVLLEHLSLRHCFTWDAITISPSSNSRLRKVSLIWCIQLQELNISAPNLESFHFYGIIPYYNISNTSGLVDAYICLKYGAYDEFYSDCRDFLSHISKVRVLTLCSTFIMSLLLDGYDGNNKITLNNLEELQFQLESINQEHLLTCIYSFFELCPAPFLEKLFIQLPEEDKDVFYEGISIPGKKDPPDVIFGNLKCVKMSNFHGSIHEMKLVKFFLDKCVALEYMLLVGSPVYDQHQAIKKYRIDSAAEHELKERMTTKIIQGQISMVEKASSEARIVYCEFLDDDKNLTPMHDELVSSSYKYLAGTLCHQVDDAVPNENFQFE